MSRVELVILVFVLLELSNVLALYFVPGTRKANGVGVFEAWENSAENPTQQDFIRYLVNWVAGAKLIFLGLLVLILLRGDAELQRLSLLVVAGATLTFYWRLFPLIRQMDKRDEIRPKGYSTILAVMIAAIVGLFLFGALA